tara:strand:- start:84 stop:320 length:237 start_codon:yes stop_codon:yes gene_type:complete
MKDQNSIQDKESEWTKWERAKSLFLESLYKPDHDLRSCSHNQKCYNEFIKIRDQIIDITRDLDNPQPQYDPFEKDEGI